ncbi:MULTISPECIES: acyltransferase family protein [unclassified Microcoleus]|uniref:acyltransferase family protein n=1 Tax=unclassified Microcoleus TaxID=2642155 RepID=UPI0025FB091A|nr:MULTISPECIES: acyltransferase family protein [unclassified Microcoleus]
MSDVAEQKSSSSRISWIDNLRAFGMLSIVLVHTGRLDSALDLYVASFCMPLFFFISGLFVKESIRQQTFIDYVKTRVQRLLIPYLFFSIFSYSLWFFVIGKIKGDVLPANPVLHFFSNIIYGVGGGEWLDFNITLWFFPCLFVTELLFFFLIRLPSHKTLGLALFGLSVIGYFLFKVVWIDNFRLPFGADIALTAVVFYGVGYLVKPYILNESFKVWYQWPMLLLGTLAYIVFSNLNEESAFIIGNFGKNYFYFYLAALSGILFWAQISRLTKPNKLFTEIGKNTLVIFPLHLLLFPFFTGVLVFVFKVPKSSLDHSNIVALAYTILSVLILIPIAWGLNLYVPFLLGYNPHKKRVNQ